MFELKIKLAKNGCAAKRISELKKQFHGPFKISSARKQIKRHLIPCSSDKNGCLKSVGCRSLHDVNKKTKQKHHCLPKGFLVGPRRTICV